MVRGGVGETGPEVWPSVGANALARLIAPTTIKITGQVVQKSKYPPRISPNRNKTPTVMTTAGPMRLRITQRRQLQRTRSFIEIHPSPLRTTLESIAKHQHANTNQDQGPEPPYAPKWKPIEIVQEKKYAQPDQNNWADRAVLAPVFKGVGRSLAQTSRFGHAHGIKGHVQNETDVQDNYHGLRSVAGVAAGADNHCHKHHNVNQRFVVFAVVNGAKPGEESQHKGNARTATGTRARSWRR